MSFFVIIVESPSAQDFFVDRAEGRLIQAGLQLAGIPCMLRTVIDTACMSKALTQGILEVCEKNHGLPVVHISAHGNRDGIELTNGCFMPWQELIDGLSLMNQHLRGELLVCMSSCEGYSCALDALKGATSRPWKTLVGNKQTPTWPETVVGFSAFYHLLNKGMKVRDAVEGMKAASGNQYFCTIDGDNFQDTRLRP
jgi:hypothetical protein